MFILIPRPSGLRLGCSDDDDYDDEEEEEEEEEEDVVDVVREEGNVVEHVEVRGRSVSEWSSEMGTFTPLVPASFQSRESHASPSTPSSDAVALTLRGCC